MSREREVHKEKDFWGNEKEVIYEGGEKVGEFRSEERGGFFGIGTETVKVQYNTDNEEVAYTKQEERGGFLGIGAENVEVRYNTQDEVEGYYRVEETGGFLGLGTHHVRVGYDTEGNKVSQTNWEKRGDFLGYGGERVRVTRFGADQSADCIYGDNVNSGGSDSSVKSRNTSNQKDGSGLWVILPLLLILGFLFSKNNEPSNESVHAKQRRDAERATEASRLAQEQRRAYEASYLAAEREQLRIDEENRRASVIVVEAVQESAQEPPTRDEMKSMPIFSP